MEARVDSGDLVGDGFVGGFGGVGCVGCESFGGGVEECLDAVDVEGEDHGLDVEGWPAIGGHSDKLIPQSQY